MKAEISHFPPSFIDPFTGYKPTCEAELSCLLGLLHQMRKVDWSKVPLLSPKDGHSALRADDLLGESYICSEYRLFASSKEEIDLYGVMPADLLCLSSDGYKVTLIENKVGSGFTGMRGDPESGQLAKQAEFLLKCKAKSRSLILLSTKNRFANNWYRTELTATLEHNQREKQISGYLMQWEDIFCALA